jgi:hypothetical protein
MPSGSCSRFGVSGWAALVGFDRDRAFYPTLQVVIASYYVLFAVMSDSVLRHRALTKELWQTGT